MSDTTFAPRRRASSAAFRTRPGTRGEVNISPPRTGRVMTPIRPSGISYRWLTNGSVPNMSASWASATFPTVFTRSGTHNKAAASNVRLSRSPLAEVRVSTRK